MGEIKSVKVDNWGVFFLQKLQNFFNKTDYCDLTLQFRDNSQLKVHRLVLSACTDYFNVLEQTCEVIDDAIIMPNGLQADVVVPIVNFMYTGTLEFELKMYNRLLRTAKDMNMTVLLKLLEAHRRTMEMHPQKVSGQTSPKPRRRTAMPVPSVNSPINVGGRSLIQTNQGNKRFVSSNTNIPQNRSVSTSNALNRPPTSGPLPVRQIGSTTFTRIKVENELDTNTPTSASGGYSLIKQQLQQPASPFEQLRKGYNNNKRPAVSTFVSPPAKKPNLEDVKEFAEQQRMRKQIAAEYGEDDYDANNIMDDDTIHNDDDDDEMMTSGGQPQTAQTSATSASAGVQTMPSLPRQQQQSEDPPGTTTIIVKNEGPDKPHTIVVKDNSNSKLNHAKIISEVLRQYPHLVKSNKNIKLKILPNAGGQAQKIIVKKETGENEKLMQPPASKFQTASKTSDGQQQQLVKITTSNVITNRQKTMQQESHATQAAPTKSTATTGTSTTSTPSATGATQKRRIDSKTMHSLIALGAENTTGPWLCLRCGRNGHPISIPSYRGFRRHLINTHKEFIDPDLCEHCGWRSKSKRELHFHMQLEHKIKTNLYIFPECQLCQQMCIDSDGLNQHLIDSHPDENKQQCIYCNKIFPEELLLYSHMKTFHKKQALEDGIIDYSDDENQTQLALPPLPPIAYDQEMEQEQKDSQQTKKVKILSDISLPIASSIVKTDSFAQQQEPTTSAASEEYLQEQEHDLDNNETKFVAADGSEVILTAEQRKEILSQLNQEHDGGSGIVMVLNDNREDQQQQYSTVETHSDQGLISHDETSQATTATNEEREEDDEEEQVAEEEDQHDDNQIYNEMKSLHSNLDDSTSQAEAAAEGTNEENSMHEDEHQNEQDDAQRRTERDDRAEHMDESKESIDNLEWAENLISEHDLADEVSSQTANKPEEKEVVMKDDDKSQDEISKKLKELTGDWSEDDDDDDEVPEESVTEKPAIKETVKENNNTSIEAKFEIPEERDKEIKSETLSKEHEGSAEFKDHEELLASLQSTEKDESGNHEEKLEISATDSETVEDDIDKALKSLHKEDEDDEINSAETYDKEKLSNDSEEKNCKTAIEPVTEQLESNGKEEESISDEGMNSTPADEEKPEEKLVKELETFNEPEASCSTAEINEETKKDLIDTLFLSEQSVTMEDTATEAQAIEVEKANLVKEENPELESPLEEKEKEEGDANATDELKTHDSEIEPADNEEFLDASPERNKTSADNIETTTAGTSDEAASTKTTDVAETSISTKEEMNLSSEERVKSLISEWADEDEDDNDTDVAPNL